MRADKHAYLHGRMFRSSVLHTAKNGRAGRQDVPEIRAVPRGIRTHTYTHSTTHSHARARQTAWKALFASNHRHIHARRCRWHFIILLPTLVCFFALDRRRMSLCWRRASGRGTAPRTTSSPRTPPTSARTSPPSSQNSGHRHSMCHTTYTLQQNVGVQSPIYLAY